MKKQIKRIRTYKQREWTKEEIQFLQKKSGVLNAEQIARKIKRSVGSVRQRANKENISLAVFGTHLHPNGQMICFTETEKLAYCKPWG